MQIISDLTVTIQNLMSARSGFAATSQSTFLKAGTALRAEAPVIRPGAASNNGILAHYNYGQVSILQLTPVHQGGKIPCFQKP
ncbi:hypothetical protein EJ076_25985 [Mesorhizobium sp. M7D.F.Ca.US.005.01.1.1]|uniref:hypothetical protein n=1 Tax=Mesorhizobium sp. M7D.F.Ca.US.005.01.1.1 TaxID=2493678 RepID=UPI000F75F1CB|nr:hypothetical protein [Mesorhizobium sp. M7D.F.Ca.US.005.01.1.1]AZO44301.1 hypothetical protein EJ076_25985 [Mesorhizobium sp. M7D.F.Ca.US.005.01.1.1]